MYWFDYISSYAPIIVFHQRGFKQPKCPNLQKGVGSGRVKIGPVKITKF